MKKTSWCWNVILCIRKSVCLTAVCQVRDFDPDARCFDHLASFCQRACSFHNQIGPNYVKHIVPQLVPKRGVESKK